MDRVTIARGFNENERARVGSLNCEAFGRKLRPGFVDEATGMAVVRATLRASVVLSLLSRTNPPGSLVFDGICVDGAARGRGIGTALLSAADDHARRAGARAVRLSVVDNNRRAGALCERRGFLPVHSGALGVLAPVYGVDRYATMERAVDQ